MNRPDPHLDEFSGDCTVTRSPPAARGVRVRVPSCASAMLFDDGQAEADARVVGANAFGAALERLGQRGDQLWGELLAGVLDGEHHRLGLNAGRDPHGAVVEAGCGRSRCARGSSSAAAGARDDPTAGAVSPEVSMVTPRSSARGRSVSAASSARSDRSTCSRVKDRWSARLSTSSASVRSIARALTTWRRSTSSPVSRFGSLRATSRSVCVIASGVRSSWEALAANLCCSATWASSRASMVSKLSASSRNSSLRPSSRIRWDSDPVAAMRVASVIPVQRGQHPAGQQPSADQTEDQQDRQPGLPRREGLEEVGAGRAEAASRVRARRSRLVRHVAQEEHPHGRQQQDAREHEEAGVAEGELEADAQTPAPYPRSPPSPPAPGPVSMR